MTSTFAALPRRTPASSAPAARPPITLSLSGFGALSPRLPFSATAPGRLSAPADNAPVEDAATVAEPDFSLIGQFGAELADPLARIQSIVGDFVASKRMTHAQMQQLVVSIEDAVQVARQSQQIARLAEGRLRQSHEPIRLDSLVQEMLAARAEVLQARGFEVFRNIKLVEIIVDPGLLSNLIETALDWAVADGNRVVVSLAIKNWPEHGMLAIKTSGLSTAGQQALQADSLSWQVMAHTASTMGVTLEREVLDGEATLLMEFARTVKQFDGLTAIEIDGSGDSVLHNGTKAMAGLRVLLVTNDSFVRAEVENAGRLLGVLVDHVPSVHRAASYVELGMPHFLVIDERLRDAAFDDLQRELKSREPNFGFLEIADQFNTFEVSSWESDSMARISRDVLRAQLPSVLTLELARVL